MSEQRILDSVNSVEDLKKLDKSKLPELCQDIRELLINTLSKTGGHLASNLGVVELTVAIHLSFDSPHDKIVWDVGHQCYTHKILTGRKSRFSTIRQEGGLSGFPRPDESEHDPFVAGHSSTSISAAFGIARAKHYANDDGYVIAVVGDGALTGGMIYEALNNAGRGRDRIIVVLNDNKMSISHNVGSMAKYLTRIRTRPSYHNFKSRLQKFLHHIPLVGKPICRLLINSKAMLKSAVYHNTIFEDMGFAYLGPVDGHDITMLRNAFTIAKAQNGPVLLHVNTIKGKGYQFAEESPKDFHGISNFDVETGDHASKSNSFSGAFGTAICNLAESDERICAITAAMSSGTGLSRFKGEYKERFYDVGIAEEHAVTFAAGLSSGGMLPVFAVYSTFLQRTYDQIIHDCAIQNLKVVFAIDRAGAVSGDGETHQGIFDVAMLRTIPNMTVFAPVTYKELDNHLNAAIYDVHGPAAVRYPRGAEPQLPEYYSPTNNDFDCYGTTNSTIIVTYGRIFANACAARDILAEKGKHIGLLKLNKIWPIAPDCFTQLLSARRVIFFEEGVRCGGVCEFFAAELNRLGYMGKYETYAIENEFYPQSSEETVFRRYRLDTQSMIEICEEDSHDQDC